MTASDGHGDDKDAGAGKAGPHTTAQDTTAQGPGAQGPGAEGEPPAQVIIEAFGGIRPMAKTLGLAVSTVQGWKERSAIPANRHDQIRAAARKNAIEIDLEVLRASASTDGAPAHPPVIEGTATAQKSEDKSDDKAGAKEQSGRGSAASAAAKPRPESPPLGAAKAASSAPGPRRGGAFLPGLVAGVVLAAVVAALTVTTRPYWQPVLSPGASQQTDAVTTALAGVDKRLADLQAAIPPDPSKEIAGLSERLSTVEAAVSQGAGQDPETRAAIDSLNAQLARLTDRLAKLEQDVSDLRGSAGAPSAEVAGRLSSEAKRLDQVSTTQSELAARLAQAEQQLKAATAAREAAPGGRETLLLLAILQLRDALQGSGPYEQPLKMLQNLADKNSQLQAIIAPLERRASTGLPSLKELQAGYPEVARRIAAIEAGKEGQGWTAGVLRRLSEAVNLRPVGMVEGDQPNAIAARAEVKLNDGDLAGALKELDGLTGAAAEAAASWRADAEARLAADQAVSKLGAIVSERFATLANG